MREIKFRAWDRERKEWFDNVDLWKVKYLNGDEDSPECDICQYTGLHDKNGKEIYEGDVVRVIPNGGVYKKPNRVVEWVIRGWNLPLDENSSWGMGEPPTYSKFEYEVIGNIYENPELTR